MFGHVVADLKQSARRIVDAQWRAMAGLAFMCLAMAAIQYDEIIAPKVERLSDGWSTAATDLGRKLSSFTL